MCCGQLCSRQPLSLAKLLEFLEERFQGRREARSTPEAAAHRGDEHPSATSDARLRAQNASLRLHLDACLLAETVIET